MKKHRKKFQPPPKPPPAKQLFSFSHWLQKNFYSLIITRIAIRHLLITSRSLQAAKPLDGKGFGMRFQKGGETVLFSTGSEVHAAPFYSQWQRGREIKRIKRLHVMMRLTERGAIISLPLSLYDLVIKSAHGQ